MIWLSLKTYDESSGKNLINLLKACKKVSRETGVKIIPCAQVVDIYRIKNELNIEVWAQHVDPIDPGRNSGWISPKSIKDAGATGTIINHAEHPLTFLKIKETITKAHKYGLKTLVICETISLAIKVAKLGPEFIAYEKGRLIAGPKSMIDVEEKSIRKLAQKISQPLIIGAGISTKKHVIKTLRAGGNGVILASAVIKSKIPEKKLRELASGFFD